MIIVSADELKKVSAAVHSTYEQSRKAISMAINHGVRKARTAVWNAIRPKYAIKQGDVYNAIMQQFSSSDTLTGLTIITAPHLKQLLFSPKPTPNFISKVAEPGKKAKKVNLHRGKQVSVEIKKGSRADIRGGFYAQMPSGHQNVFVRLGKERIPIKSMMTIGVTEMASSQKAQIMEEAKQETLFELQRQMNRFLKNP
jgi:hypothetical protein